MNQNKLFSASLFSVILFLLISFTIHAQQNDKPRASLQAGVWQRIGIDTDITIEYSRPGVKGRTIWGDLVPYGLAEGNQYSDNNPYPWRGGANEATTIEFSKDVLINGNKVPAGKYSLHFIPTEESWTIMFNKNIELWGSYQYNEEEDVLKIEVSPEEYPHTEWLRYGFDNLNGTSATAYLAWEKLKVPFEISVAE